MKHLRTPRGATWWRVAAVLAAAVLGTLITRGTAEAAPIGIASGYLDWGVKASFRSYVTGPIAHGSVLPEDGAVQTSDGTFRFPLRGGTFIQDGTSPLFFDGGVRFTGHDGELDLTITGLRVTMIGGTGTLRASISTNTSSGSRGYSDVALAQLTGSTSTSTETVATWGGLSAILAAQGAPAFSGFYTAGTELDPVTIRLTLVGPGSTATALPADGGSGGTGNAVTTVTDGSITVPVTGTSTATVAAGDSTLVVGQSGTSVARLEAPEGALPAGAAITAAPVKDLAQMAEAAPPPASMTLVFGLVLQAKDEAGTSVTKLAGPASLEFNLPLSALPFGTVLDDLMIATWDGTRWKEVPRISSWAALEGGQAARFQVTGRVDHLSIFGVLSAPGMGTFRPAPQQAGVTLTVWQGGGYERLKTAMAGAQSLWVTVDGQFLAYVPGLPDFVNAPFIERYPEGVPAGTPVVAIR